MAHRHHLEKEKYRQWVKAGLGLGYLKEGLTPFCDDIAKQQHKDILDNIKQTKNLPTVTCGHCALKTLKPDHVKIGKNQCPFGQANCNCCYMHGKIACPNNVCGAIYDYIITNHASTPPAPTWKNTQTQQWTGDPWSIAKCFINAPGYDQKISAADTDCTGLLHVIINNKYFHNHIQGNVAGANVFSKVRQYRNEIFHSSTMELEEADANSYIDDMIAVLQDGKELINRKDAQDAVKKLEELKNEDFIVTTENMKEVLGDIREEFENIKRSTEGLATKDDLKKSTEGLATKDAMKKSTEGLATKDDLKQSTEGLATKGDLKNSTEGLATKDDLKKSTEGLATKDDLKKSTEGLATKDDLKQSTEGLATKGDLKSSTEGLATKGDLKRSTEGLATKDNCDEINMKISALEMKMISLESLINEQTKEIKRLKTDDSAQREHEYEKSKLELQKSLIEFYREDTLRMSALPQQQECNLCDFKDVYVRPQMLIESKGNKKSGEVDDVKSMSDIFTKDDKPKKSIYVEPLGEAGSVESSFLINYVRLVDQSTEDDFSDIREMVIKSKSNKKSGEADVISMSDIFTKDDKPIKSIYILGEAGSGKSSFCKSLINYWCLAHSEEEQSIEDEFSGVKEMKKFNFLFHLPLRHYTDKTTIKEMLEEKYEHPALTKILEYESRTCLVVLDGLDEWASTASNRPPERDALKQYTVLTTSRPWKIATLGISDNEIRHKIIIKGFDEKASLNNLIGKTVSILNKTFEKDKVPSDCERALAKQSKKSLIHTAIMLQQLICLWFDDKLHDGTTRCALHSEMLELFFDWHEKKYPDDPLFTEMKKKSKDLKNVELPRYLRDTEVCKLYSYIIHDVSRLAYETLFYNTKEASLSFDSSTFEQLKISNNVKSCCLKLGILSEDKCLNLSASKSRRSAIAFVHKSLQEYLAAVYIAIRCEKHTAQSADSGNADLSDHCAQLIRDLFSKCTTLDEVLEQADVFIMLCGLEPRIATFISKYIYDIISRDRRVQEYRRRINNQYSSIEYVLFTIQSFIIQCIEEVQASQTRTQSNFYLGDIIVSFTGILGGCHHLPTHVISPDCVMSFGIFPSEMKKDIRRVLKFMTQCQRLEAVKVGYIDGINDEDIKCICDAIKGNTSTMKTLSLKCMRQVGVKYKSRTIVRRLPEMSHLVALRIMQLTLSHEHVISLCNFLSNSSQLEHIVIDYTYCEPRTECLGQHEVDLFKHHQLQCLKLPGCLTVIRVNTSNLKIFKCSTLKNTNSVKLLEDISTAYKLTEIEWRYRYDYGFANILSWHTVTDKLITLLPVLHQLRELSLGDFTFTDNIMKCPIEMKSMKIISLNYVRMSLTTWRKFVDSLHQTPLPLKVEACWMCITRDGEECNPYIKWLARTGGEEAAAWLYVIQQRELFDVNYKEKESICFSTEGVHQSAC